MVIDSSSLISLARAGLLALLRQLPEPPTLLPAVWDEVVSAGKAGQHADAVAIESVFAEPPAGTTGRSAPVDDQVVQAAVDDGTLLANDLALGRRARNLGARWLRTADLIVLLAETGRASAADARAGIHALGSAGRITVELRDDYLRRLQ